MDFKNFTKKVQQINEDVKLLKLIKNAKEFFTIIDIIKYVHSTRSNK